MPIKGQMQDSDRFYFSIGYYESKGFNQKNSFSK